MGDRIDRTLCYRLVYSFESPLPLTPLYFYPPTCYLTVRAACCKYRAFLYVWPYPVCLVFIPKDIPWW